MDPLPPSNVPGNTESEKFDNAVRKIFSVPKEELLEREAEWQRKRRARRRRGSRCKASLLPLPRDSHRLGPKKCLRRKPCSFISRHHFPFEPVLVSRELQSYDRNWHQIPS